MEDDDDDLRMSRPFGIQSLLFGITTTRKASSTSDNNIKVNKYPIIIQSIDPSGITQSWVARALGYGNLLGLQYLWKRNMSVKDVKEMCLDILMEFYEKDSLDGDLEIVYEIMDGSSVWNNVERRPFF